MYNILSTTVDRRKQTKSIKKKLKQKEGSKKEAGEEESIEQFRNKTK